MNRLEVGTRPREAVVDEVLAELDRLGLLVRGSKLRSGSGRAEEFLVELRHVLPRRAVTNSEAEVLAERLGSKLRSQMESLSPVLGESQIAALPWIAEIEHVSDLPKSGMASRLPDGRWVISINGDEHELRQRFSLAHELCHTVIDEVGERLLPDQRFKSHEERLERFCDRFAGALLMPRPLLRADWVDGFQSVDRLSRRYRVSRPAVRVRLNQLGLSMPIERCAGAPRNARLS